MVSTILQQQQQQQRRRRRRRRRRQREEMITHQPPVQQQQHGHGVVEDQALHHNMTDLKTKNTTNSDRTNGNTNDNSNNNGECSSSISTLTTSRLRSRSSSNPTTMESSTSSSSSSSSTSSSSSACKFSIDQIEMMNNSPSPFSSDGSGLSNDSSSRRRRCCHRHRHHYRSHDRNRRYDRERGCDRNRSHSCPPLLLSDTNNNNVSANDDDDDDEEYSNSITRPSRAASQELELLRSSNLPSPSSDDNNAAADDDDDADDARQRHDAVIEEIIRLCNPSPFSYYYSSTSSSSSSSFNNTSRSNKKRPTTSAAASSSTTSSSASLLQRLLERRPHHNHHRHHQYHHYDARIHPPSKIYLPSIPNHHHHHHHRPPPPGRNDLAMQTGGQRTMATKRGPYAGGAPPNAGSLIPTAPETAMVDHNDSEYYKARNAQDGQALSWATGGVSSGVGRSRASAPVAPPPPAHQMRGSGNDASYGQEVSTTPAAPRMYDLCRLLQTEITSLQTRHQTLQTSLANLEEETKVRRLEVLRSLAACGGDAKLPQFAEAVARLEPIRKRHAELEEVLKEVERVLRWKRNKMEGLLFRIKMLYYNPLHGPLPFTPHPVYPDTTIQPSSSRSSNSKKLEGQWFTLTKPTYPDCLGFNDDGDPMYSLGRMSFEMFRPGDLVLSIDAVFNPVDLVERRGSSGGGNSVGNGGSSNNSGSGGTKKKEGSFSVPKTMQEEVSRILEDANTGSDEKHVLRTYHIVTAFLIEPYSPSFGPNSPNSIVQSPIRGIMTVYGYALPDPNTPDRLSVWFSGGKMECGECRKSYKFQVWKRIFGDAVPTSPAATAGKTTGAAARGGGGMETATMKKRIPRRRRTFREGVVVIAAKLLLGAEGYDDGMDEETGTMGYSFSKPVGGHGKTYVDILHLDEQTRVMRGHAGTLYVFNRVGRRKGMCLDE